MIAIKELYFDFDGTIVNSVKKICEIYNDDFSYYKTFQPANWIQVNEWNMGDECPLLSQEMINNYFCQPRFFHELEFMDNSEEVLYKLNDDGYKIYIPSMGETPNLRLKERWIKTNIPFANFVGIDFHDYPNKAHIDMSNGVMFDDNSAYLESTNAKHKVIFGDIFSWNRDSKRDRCFNWFDVYRYIKEMN